MWSDQWPQETLTRLVAKAGSSNTASDRPIFQIHGKVNSIFIHSQTRELDKYHLD